MESNAQAKRHDSKLRELVRRGGAARVASGPHTAPASGAGSGCWSFQTPGPVSSKSSGAMACRSSADSGTPATAPLARHSVSSAGNTRAAAVTVRRSAIRTGRHGGRGVSPARELRRSAGRLGFEGGGATPRQFQCCTLGKLALSTKGAPDRASGRARSGARSPA